MQKPTLPGAVVEEPQQIAMVGFGVVVIALDQALPPATADSIRPVHVLDRVIFTEEWTRLGLLGEAGRQGLGAGVNPPNHW